METAKMTYNAGPFCEPDAAEIEESAREKYRFESALLSFYKGCQSITADYHAKNCPTLTATGSSSPALSAASGQPAHWTALTIAGPTIRTVNPVAIASSQAEYKAHQELTQ